jgi:putative MATE family efflux protein
MNQTSKDSLYYLEQAPVAQAIVHMALPMILSMVLDLLYNMIDAYFIGQLNNTAMLAAITLAFPFQILLMGVGQIFGTGGGTLIARLLGEKNYEGARKASAVNFYLALFCGLALALTLTPVLTPLLHWVGASGEAFPHTYDFALVIVLGSPLIILTIALSETLRAEGASTAAMTGMMLSVAINILLDPFFLFVLRLNVMGAALATVAANGVAVAYFIGYILKKSPVQSVHFQDFRPSLSMLADIFKIGASAFLFSTLMIISSSLFNNTAMRYGDNVIAAFGIANRVVQICEFLGVGIFTGVVPLIAYAYAAGKTARLKQVISTTTLSFIAVTVTLGTLFLAFRQPIFRVFSQDPGVLTVGYVILTAMLVSTLFSGFCTILTNLFQAFGAGVQSNTIAVLRGVVMIPLIFLGNQLFGLTGVIWALPAAEICACLVSMLLWLASKEKFMTVPLAQRQALPVEGD